MPAIFGGAGVFLLSNSRLAILELLSFFKPKKVKIQFFYRDCPVKPDNDTRFEILGSSARLTQGKSREF